VADTRDPLITQVIASMQNAAQMTVIAKDFPRVMETFPCSHPDFYSLQTNANLDRARQISDVDGSVEAQNARLCQT
jgi:hypothetical protein